MGRYTITIEGVEDHDLGRIALDNGIHGVIVALEENEAGRTYSEIWGEHIAEAERSMTNWSGEKLELGPLPDGSVIKVEKEAGQ